MKHPVLSEQSIGIQLFNKFLVGAKLQFSSKSLRSSTGHKPEPVNFGSYPQIVFHLRFILILSFSLYLGVSKCNLSTRFPNNGFVYISCITEVVTYGPFPWASLTKMLCSSIFY